MLQGFFNYDNPVWRFIGKLGDLILLNILWMICSIPVFTIGASTTAVYYVTLKLARDEDSSTVKAFFRSFRENFKQATAIWLLLLAIGMVLSFDFWVFYTGRMNIGDTGRNILLAIFGGFLLVYLFILTYVFPLQARFYNPVKRTLLNAFFMSIRHLFQTIGIVAMDLLIGAAFCLSLFYLPQAFMLFIMFGMPLTAFANSYFFTAIFKRYTPGEEDPSGGRPPLFDEEDEAVQEAIRNLKGESVPERKNF